MDAQSEDNGGEWNTWSKQLLLAALMEWKWNVFQGTSWKPCRTLESPWTTVRKPQVWNHSSVPVVCVINKLLCVLWQTSINRKIKPPCSPAQDEQNVQPDSYLINSGRGGWLGKSSCRWTWKMYIEDSRRELGLKRKDSSDFRMLSTPPLIYHFSSRTA